MNHFSYRSGRLFAEDVDLARLADEVGTPCYVYSTATLERHYRNFAAALPPSSLIAFSVKANGNLAVLKTLARLGAGADVVSGGELKKAMAAGIPPERIVFSGVGKTRAEMHAALEAGIHQFNVESEPELLALDAVARSLGKRAPIALRINPDVDARTHAKITTGTAENKFGVPWSRARDTYRMAATLEGIRIEGVDLHIGSQITELGPFEVAFSRAIELIGVLRADGHAIRRADFGGGLGVPYRLDEKPPPDPSAYGAIIAKLTRGLGVELIFEPGRLIAANAGILLARVIYVKKGESKIFLILDAGMNDLIRPALYDAHHDILAVREPGPERISYDVVGPVCESSDVFAREMRLPPLAEGDLVAIMTAGAYGAVMSSAYNARPLAPEVLVNADRWSVVRPRVSDDTLVGQDRLPDWLEG
ncbi:MAG TPA: diaminopimelate decarboxylase [Rhizomicrobium sp.]|nr:diaminopimelate decarboxylase [Rhizomicrobium sp.]